MKTINADGTEQPFEIDPAKNTLDQLQAAVGGMIEIVRTRDGGALVLDEEGKLKGKPINPKATELYIYGEHDPIVGTVIVYSEEEAKGL